MKQILAVGVTLILTACSSIPVDVQNGQLDTNYSFGEKEATKNIKIALVSPEGDINRVEQILSIKQQNNKRLAVHQKYLKEVKQAFNSSFEDLITTRGFTYSGPYASFDEISYRDKKASYLAVVPYFEVAVSESDVIRENFSSYVEEKGNLQVDGSIVIKIIEPLTKQVISQKRIDLTKLNIKESYIVQQETKSGTGLVGLALDSAVKQAMAPEKLVVTYDKAYANAMSKFYKGTMLQLNKYVSSEEILDYQADIKELKSNKRF